MSALLLAAGQLSRSFASECAFKVYVCLRIMRWTCEPYGWDMKCVCWAVFPINCSWTYPENSGFVKIHSKHESLMHTTQRYSSSHKHKNRPRESNRRKSRTPSCSVDPAVEAIHHSHAVTSRGVNLCWYKSRAISLRTCNTPWIFVQSKLHIVSFHCRETTGRRNRYYHVIDQNLNTIDWDSFGPKTNQEVSESAAGICCICFT